MASEDLTGDVIFNEISEEDLHSQESLPPNQYWLTPDPIQEGSVVTTDTEQTITANKRLDCNLLDKDGDAIITTRVAGSTIMFNSYTNSLVFASPLRPKVTIGSYSNNHMEEIAFLTDIPADAIVEQSLGQKGYIKFKNGIMIQWLNANHSNAGTHSWALPFTSATSYCMATSTLGASSSASATVSIRNQAYSKTSTGFSAYNTAFASGGCDYIAIGY